MKTHMWSSNLVALKIFTWKFGFKFLNPGLSRYQILAVWLNFSLKHFHQVLLLDLLGFTVKLVIEHFLVLSLVHDLWLANLNDYYTTF